MYTQLKKVYRDRERETAENTWAHKKKGQKEYPANVNNEIVK